MNPATQSKINWTALAVALVNVAAVLGYIPDELESSVVTLVNILGPSLIVVFRTWFTAPRE